MKASIKGSEADRESARVLKAAVMKREHKRRGKAFHALRQWLHWIGPHAGPLDPSHFDGVDVPHVRVHD